VAKLAVEDIIPLHLAEISFPEGHPLAGQEGELFAFLIGHPRGPILFETGIGRGSEDLDRYYNIRHRTIEDELARTGYRLGDIRAIVNSHLHFDHAGNNRLFPGIPIYVQASERRAAREPNYTVPEWIEFLGAEYAVIEGDTQVADGLRIVSTPGHTLGHQSLVVETTAGAVALAGQAIYSKTEFEFIRRTGQAPTEDPPLDPDAYLASAKRLIELHPRRIYFSHDRSVWAEKE